MAKGLMKMASNVTPGSFASIARRSSQAAPMDQPISTAQSDLLSTIHEQIIPQLMLAHCTDEPLAEPCVDGRVPPTDAEIAKLANIAVEQDLATSLKFVDQILRAGVSLDIVLLKLVAPAARLLGDEWLDDRRSFTEVTLGLAIMQEVVHVLGATSGPGLTGGRGFVVLACPAPEQHTLGIHLLGYFLRRAGWEVEVAPAVTENDLVALVQSERVEMLGISVKNTDSVKILSRVISAVKKASMNPDLMVLVGGAPELAHRSSEIGCQYCSDPNDAVRWLDEHVKSAAVSGR